MLKPEAILKRLVRLVAPYFIGLFSLLSVSANNFLGRSTISSPVNPPVITLNVTDIQIVEVGSFYTELGAYQSLELCIEAGVKVRDDFRYDKSLQFELYCVGEDREGVTITKEKIKEA